MRRSAVIGQKVEQTAARLKERYYARESVIETLPPYILMIVKGYNSASVR